MKKAGISTMVGSIRVKSSANNVNVFSGNAKRA